MPISTDGAIATEVRAEMAAKRIRVMDLATALQLSPASTSMRLHGHVAMSIGELSIVSELLGTSVTELIERARVRTEKASA